MNSTVESLADGADRIRSGIAEASKPLLRIDGRKLDLLFTLALTVSVAWIVVRTATADWGSQTKLTPLLVGVPTLLLLFGLAAVQSSSRAAAVAGKLAAGDVLGVDERVQEMQTRTEESVDTSADATTDGGRKAVLVMCFWVLLLFGLVLLIGFTVGIPAYLLTYYRTRADLSWIRSVGLTAFIWAFVVVIFIYVLNAPLYPGVLGVHLPFLG